MTEYILPFNALRIDDINIVGGKNASLGEMLSQLSSVGIKVPMVLLLQHMHTMCF